MIAELTGLGWLTLTVTAMLAVIAVRWVWLRAQQSLRFRRVAFATTAWMVAVPSYVFVFDRELWGDLDRDWEDARLRVAIIMLLPLIVGASHWLYRKTVSPAASD